MPTCQIQWIDDQGKPTPDSNPSIGTVVCQFYTQDNYPDGESAPLHICAEHANRLGKLPNWTFEAHRITDMCI
jgi:hypothetical protein